MSLNDIWMPLVQLEGLEMKPTKYALEEALTSQKPCGDSRKGTCTQRFHIVGAEPIFVEGIGKGFCRNPVDAEGMTWLLSVIEGLQGG